MLRVFIGYDHRQPVAFQVAAHSIWKHASHPVSVTRLQLNQLPLVKTGLTEFTYSRFLVPYLCQYQGTAVFVDSDFLCRADINELFAYPLAFPETAVFVTKNAKRFEWPSLMVFNNPKCTALTPAYIEANQCFDFAWAESVGALPPAWNHLVGYDAPNPDAKMVHFTQGIPCWPETKECEFSKEWAKALKETVSTTDFKTLMGKSVHAKPVYDRLKQREHAAATAPTV
jgi:lipopolysaccharide biosynthesis glycosyltransferase